MEQKPWYTSGINFMNPQVTTTFKSYMTATYQEGGAGAEEEQDKRDLQLKDVDEHVLADIAGKIEKLYAKLKEENKDTKFASLFQVDEARDEVERQLKELGEDGKFSPFLKHSNQQHKIIVTFILL